MASFRGQFTGFSLGHLHIGGGGGGGGTSTDIYNKTHTVPCIDTKTNSCTATQTNSSTETDTNTSDMNRRIYRKKNQFYNFYFFVSILSLVRTLFLILRDLKIMNVILVFTIVP